MDLWLVTYAARCDEKTREAANRTVEMLLPYIGDARTNAAKVNHTLSDWGWKLRAKVVGSGFVVGVGVIEGVECVILGHDPSVRAGAFNPFNSKKLMRGLEIARENRMPYVQFVESAGADLRGASGDGKGDPNAEAEAALQREVDDGVVKRAAPPPCLPVCSQRTCDRSAGTRG